MSDRRFEPSLDSTPHATVAKLVGLSLDAGADPLELARTLDRLSARLRHDADGGPTEFSITRAHHMNLDYAVYDAEGTEYLFESYEGAAGWIAEQFEGGED